ncbi:hypothetical protein ACH4LK_01330 [Streptomyces lydicus]
MAAPGNDGLDQSHVRLTVQGEAEVGVETAFRVVHDRHRPAPAPPAMRP